MDTEKLIRELKQQLVPYLESHKIDITSGNVECIYKDRHKNKSDNKPSMGLLPKKDGTHCFTCGSVADIFQWANKLDKLPIGSNPEFYTRTLPILAQNLLGIKYIPDKLSPEERHKYSIRNAYSCALEYIVQGTETTNAYIEARGWSEGIKRRYQLGGVPSFQAFVSYMIRCGFTREFLTEISLYRDDVFNENMLIIPIFDANNRIIRFSGRVIDSSISQGPKYINTSNILINEDIPKLYGVNHINGQDFVYAVEGFADVITLYKYGYENAVSLMGCNINIEQITELKRIGVRNITLMLDGDKAWEGSFPAQLSSLMKNSPMNLAIALLPEQLDPDEYLKKYTHLDNIEAITPLAYLMNNSGSAVLLKEQKIDIFTDTIAGTTSAIGRERMIKELSTATGIDTKTIRNEVLEKRQNLSFLLYKEEQEIKNKVAKMTKQPDTSIDDITYYINNYKDSKRRARNIDPVGLAVDIVSETQQYSEMAIDEPAFNLGTLKQLEKDTEGLSRDPNVMIITGIPHAGKSSWCRYLTMQIALNNDDVTCVYFSMEDSREKIIPSFMSVINGYPTNLNKKKVRMASQGQAALDAYDYAWSKIKELTVNRRLLVYDRTIGGSLEDIDMVMSALREESPNGDFFVVIDSMNALKDNRGDSNIEAVIRERIIGVRELTTKHRCPIVTIAELRKTDNKDIGSITGEDISGSYKVEYSSDFTVALGVGKGDIESAPQFPWEDKIFHEHTSQPIINVIIKKNKINGTRKNYKVIFVRDRCYFEECPENTVIYDTDKKESRIKQLDQNPF